MNGRSEEIKAQLEAGLAVPVNLSTDRELIAWAKERGLFVRVDRRSIWGNPFRIGIHGDRAEVCDRFEREHLPELIDRIPELKGKALGCWCSPERCHANALAREANRSFTADAGGTDAAA